MLITQFVGYTNTSNINYKSYKERFVYFKVDSLDIRRLKIDLTTIFKNFNNYTDINISDILNISNNCITRGNCKKLNVIGLHNYNNAIKNIINNRLVNICNSLNNDIIKSVYVSSFKNKINKISFDKQLFLTDIYNVILLYVSFCILIIALSLRGFFLNLFCCRKLGFLYISRYIVYSIYSILYYTINN